MSNENSTFSKWGRLSLFCSIAIVLAIMFLYTKTGKPKDQYITDLAHPIIALNFDPGSSEKNPQGGWLYNIATGKLQDAGDIPQKVCDFDAKRNALLGIHEGVVVETDIRDGSSSFKGAAEYGGSGFVPHTLQWLPSGEDYSALTQSGILVLWEAKANSYRELARFSWYKYAFAYSWLEDGKRVCVPDESGIAILDIETLEQCHWLTVDIPFSDGGPLPPACKRPFVVSPKGDFLVFCGSEEQDKIMICAIDETGILQSPEPLTDELYDGTCWFDFSFDGESFVYGVVKVKNALFNPQFYEVWLYHAGERHKLLESKGLITPGVGVYW